MSTFFNEENSIQSLSKHANMLTLTSSAYPNQNQLMSLLFQQKSIIQKLLEQQNTLSDTFQLHQRYQTTDSQHTQSQTQTFQMKQRFQNQSQLLKSVQETLSHHQSQYNKFQRQTQQFYHCLNDTHLVDQIKAENVSNEGTYIKQDEQCSKYFESAAEQKRMIKSFVKSLQQFMIKKVTLRGKIFANFSQDQSQFFDYFKMVVKRTQCLSELKSVYRGQRNGYGRIVRIFVSIYLKKFFLEQIKSKKHEFWKVHLKSRKILMKVVMNYN